MAPIPTLSSDHSTPLRSEVETIPPGPQLPPLRPLLGEKAAQNGSIDVRAPVFTSPCPPLRPILKHLAPAAALLAALPAQAQTVPATPSPAYARAIAAGYKAAMLCSGIFFAHRTEAQVEADELQGIYPEYQPLLAALPATVDRQSQFVTVAFDPGLPPRRASFEGERGCVTAPIGSQFPQIIAKGAWRAEPFKPDPRRWPQGDAGIAPRPGKALAATVAGAFDAATYGKGAKTTGVVILADGQLIAERYAEGWGPFVANRTWSVAKSIAGTLIGTLQSESAGKLDPGQPAPVPEWRRPGDPRGTITLANLMQMGSGLHSGAAGNRTDGVYFGGVAVEEEVPGWPLEAAPGTRFRYANDDILLAVYAARAVVTPARYDALAPDFFRTLGMTHTVAERDWHGNYILSSQVWSTARDLARLGQFWLQDGVWQGRRLLPEGWLTFMTTPAGPQPEGDGPGYGATIWLFGGKQGLPAGSYAAQGNRGQYVMVIPSRKLVIVRRGEDGPARFDIARFAADIAKAVP